MKRSMKLVACVCLVAFSNLLAVTAVAQEVPHKLLPSDLKVEAPAAKVPAHIIGEPVRPVRTDDIAIPLRGGAAMPKTLTVEKGGVGVVAPVSVNVTVPEALPPIVVVNVPPPPPEPPIYKKWWFWTIVGGVVATGAVVGGVCGSGHCGGKTTNVHINGGKGKK